MHPDFLSVGFASCRNMMRTSDKWHVEVRYSRPESAWIHYWRVRQFRDDGSWFNANNVRRLPSAGGFMIPRQSPPGVEVWRCEERESWSDVLKVLFDTVGTIIRTLAVSWLRFWIWILARKRAENQLRDLSDSVEFFFIQTQQRLAKSGRFASNVGTFVIISLDFVFIRLAFWCGDLFSSKRCMITAIQIVLTPAFGCIVHRLTLVWTRTSDLHGDQIVSWWLLHLRKSMDIEGRGH